MKTGTIFTGKFFVAVIGICSLWALLGLQVYLEGGIDLLSGGLILISFFLAIFLLHTTIRETRQRKTLEEMAGNLQTLNTTLETRIAERTSDMFNAKIHTDAIIDSMTIGLVEYRGDNTIVRLNKAAEEMLGIKRTQATGKTLLPADMGIREFSSLGEVTFFTSTEAMPTQKKDTPYAATVDDISIDYPMKRDLQVITVLLPTAESGQGFEHNFIKLLRDVTREKMVERSKSNFITVAAHQLRTPLSAIRWALNLLLADTTRLTPDEANILKSGENATEQAITLINDLLDVSQIEEGRFGYEFAEGDLAETIRTAMAPFQKKATEKNVSLDISTPPILQKSTFDAKKVGMIVQNLLLNAVTYTPSGGHVSITLGYGERFATITIADTGVGIPADETMRIFTKFFRSKKALQLETSGSGLGLYIAKNIVERHGGRITLGSEEDKGTIITFTLPLRKEDIPEE